MFYDIIIPTVSYISALTHTTGGGSLHSCTFSSKKIQKISFFYCIFDKMEYNYVENIIILIEQGRFISLLAAPGACCSRS